MSEIIQKKKSKRTLNMLIFFVLFTLCVFLLGLNLGMNMDLTFENTAELIEANNKERIGIIDALKNNVNERIKFYDAPAFKGENNYINADEWTEKCTEYENYEEHEIDYIIKLTDELACNFGYRACLVHDNLNITCEQQKTECIEQYSTPHIKTINQSLCVETILVKKTQTTPKPIRFNETTEYMADIIIHLDAVYYE